MERKSSFQKWVKNIQASDADDVAGLNGGAGRDRTDDLLIANEALSQLSYSPTYPWKVPLLTAPAGPSFQRGSRGL